MKVDKSSLASTLLEVGEENAAVLLIRSPLPEQLDTERDLVALSQLGLEPDAVEELIGTLVERMDSSGDNGEHLERTVSKRWADLVEQWISARSDGP